MISVNWEEPRLKLLRHYSLDELWDFWFGGMWDFIHDVRFYSEMRDFSRENPQSRLIITNHNEKCILIHCTTAAATIKYVSRGILALKYCDILLFGWLWDYRVFEMWDFIQNHAYTRSDQHNFWFVRFKYIISYHDSVFGIKLKYFIVMKNGSCEHQRRFGEKTWNFAKTWECWVRSF